MTWLSLIMVMMYSLLVTCLDSLKSLISDFSNTSIIFCWQGNKQRHMIQNPLLVCQQETPKQIDCRCTYVDFGELFLGLSYVKPDLGFCRQNIFRFRHNLLHRLQCFLYLEETHKEHRLWVCGVNLFTIWPISTPIIQISGHWIFRH